MRIGIPLATSKIQYYINQAYVSYVKAAGFEPIVIVQELSPEIAIDSIDGLLLPGGIDIDPIYYGEDNIFSFSVDPKRDEFERTLLHLARDSGIPIFGICRGMQLIAREYLMANSELQRFVSYYENIQNHQQTDSQSLSRTVAQHYVRYLPSELYGTEEDDFKSMPVNSMHHQAVTIAKEYAESCPVEDFKVLAWTPRGFKKAKKKEIQDVVCEALTISNWGSPILAVQWHPEEMGDVALIQNFFNKAKTSEILTDVMAIKNNTT